MSDISPDARRVLTRLSPSVPPGCVSTFIVTFGCAAVYAEMSALLTSLLFEESSMNKDSVTAAPLAAGAEVACPPDGAVVACPAGADVGDGAAPPPPPHPASASEPVRSRTCSPGLNSVRG